MRLLSRLAFLGFFVIACGLITAFVVVNNGPATIYLWPSDITLSAEIWVFILGAFAAGILFGGLFIWINLLGLRTRLWARDRQIARLSAALETAENKPEEPLLPEYSPPSRG
jgi:uncharacterized integral membrane protein